MHVSSTLYGDCLKNKVPAFNMSPNIHTRLSLNKTKTLLNLVLKLSTVEPLYGYVRTSILLRFFHQIVAFISGIVLRENFNDPIDIGN